MDQGRQLRQHQEIHLLDIVLSDQAHSSNIKAIRILGFQQHQIRIIPTDNEFKISINTLKNEIAKDKLHGKKPFCIIATAGTTNTGSVDSLENIALICGQENLWFHIDAAYGGAAILSKKGKIALKGIEKADSLTKILPEINTSTIKKSLDSLKNKKFTSGIIKQIREKKE
jgi:glutamate/tyrosine decarboxylase-like PLP-dependent enzyme